MIHNRTGMDVEEVAKEIYQYTSGYPFLVSAICKILDEALPRNTKQSNYKSTWSKEGVEEAVKTILKANTPLLEDMVGQLEVHKDLRDMVEAILCQGKWISYCPYIEPIETGMTLGLLKEKDGQVVVANRIFEMRMLNMPIAEESIKSDAFRQGECIRS